MDSRRLGVTGLSGGGAISWFLAAADTRVACAAPVCQTGTIEQHAVDRTIDSHCDCAFWVNTEQWCTPDLGALIAPRPLLVAAGTDDPLWRPYAFREALRRIRRQYAALGVPGNVRLVEDAATHGYTPALSRAVYAWFQRHLQGHTGPVDGPDARPAEPPAALRVFHGRPPARNRMKDMDRRLIRLAPDPGSPGRADWKRRSRAIRAALRRGPFRYVPADGGLERLIEMRNDGAAALVYRSYLFDQADGLRLRLRTAAPASFHPARDAGVAFALSPDAQSSRGLPGARNLAPGRLIACIEVRNTGDHSVGPGYAWTLRRTYPLLGQSLPERQVSDLLAGITLLRRETGLRRLAVFGAGHTAVLALYAALLNPSITELILEAPPTTHTDPATPEIPGILKVGDLPELLGAVYPRPITIRGALPAAYRWTARLYRRLGAGARFRRLPADAPWTPWAG